MERFSADYIRQQPEYQFLLHRSKSQVIETRMLDGEIKLCIGELQQQPAAGRPSAAPRLQPHRLISATKSSGMVPGTVPHNTGAPKETVSHSAEAPKETVSHSAEAPSAVSHSTGASSAVSHSAEAPSTTVSHSTGAPSTVSHSTGAPSAVSHSTGAPKSTVSHTTVYHLTTADVQNSATSDRPPSGSASKEVHPRQKQIGETRHGGLSGQSSEGSLQRHRPVSTGAAATGSAGTREKQDETEESDDRVSDGIRDSDADIGANQTAHLVKSRADGGTCERQAESPTDGNGGANELSQRRETFEQSPNAKHIAAGDNSGTHSEQSAKTRNAASGVSHLSVGLTAVVTDTRRQRKRGRTEDTGAINPVSSNVNANPVSSTVELQPTNQINEGGPVKTEDITVLSADTESKHSTGEKGSGHPTDPSPQVIGKDSASGESGHFAGQGNSSHAVSEERNIVFSGAAPGTPHIVGDPTNSFDKNKNRPLSGKSNKTKTRPLSGQSNKKKNRPLSGQSNKKKNRPFSGQSKDIDNSCVETMVSLLDHASVTQVPEAELFTDTTKNGNKNNDVADSNWGYEYDDAIPEAENNQRKGSVHSRKSVIKRNERPKKKVKCSSAPRSAVQQETSEGDVAVRSNSPRGKFQKRKKGEETSTSDLRLLGKIYTQEVTEQKEGKDNKISRQNRLTYSQSKTAVSVSSDPNIGFYCDDILTDFQSKNQEENEKPEHFLDSSVSEVLSHSESWSTATHAKERGLLMSRNSEQVTSSLDTPVTHGEAGANDKIMGHATRQIDAAISPTNDQIQQNRKQHSQIDQSGKDRYLMVGMMCVDADRQGVDSQSFPTPVTRVDVTGLLPLRNGKTSDADSSAMTDPGENHQGRAGQSSQAENEKVMDTGDSAPDKSRNSTAGAREPQPVLTPGRTHASNFAANSTDVCPTDTSKTRHGTDVDPSRQTKDVMYADQGKENSAMTTSFTIPIIVVDEASTVGDDSDYSDDMDAVSIDADEYLAYSQNAQSENQGEAEPHQQKATYFQQLTDRPRNVERTLYVPANSELSGERMPSAPHRRSHQHVLRPRLESVHTNSSSAALELSGLRTALAPSTYNMEFGPHTTAGPRSPRHADTATSIRALRPSQSKPGTPRPSPRASSRRSPRPHATSGDVTLPRCTSSSPPSPRNPTPLDDLTSPSMLPHPPPADGSQPSGLRSALGSRRSSLASVGAVHWDQAVTAVPHLNRQPSWQGGNGNGNERPSTPIRGNPVRRRHSTALGTRHENDPRSPHVLSSLFFGTAAPDKPWPFNNSAEAAGLKPDSADPGWSIRRHSVCLAELDLCVQQGVGERRLSTASAMSAGQRSACRVSSGQQEEVEVEESGVELARQVSQYDPKVEKSERYMHQGENAFNKACQWLSPVRRGLRTLQVQYSQTNTAHNDSLIFAHLLRAAHVKNAIVEESVFNTERRLYTRRHTDTRHATTFFDIHPTAAGDGGQKTKQAAGGGRRTSYSTVAKKEKERKQRIKKKNEEIEMGYTPRAQSLRKLGPEDMEAILRQCRHLRVSPHLQQHLYTDTDVDVPILERAAEHSGVTVTSLT